MASKYLVPAYIPRSMATGILPENGPRQSQGFGSDTRKEKSMLMMFCSLVLRMFES
jgi:hypothetical protein